MNEFSLHPNVYSTGVSDGLLSMLERIWVRELKPGDGTIYLISGFANYNGGVRFFDTFRNHIKKGGKIIAVLGGSTSQRLSSKQIVEELLSCGVEVILVNRRKLLHAKCYGISTSNDQFLVVTSGNFTGPGMTQNGEASLLLDSDGVKNLKFSWNDILKNIKKQKWDFHQPSIKNPTDPAWKLLYDERPKTQKIDSTDEVTMLLTLGHADTVRINATRGSNASKGSQYFWLTKDAFGFFPPLTIRNQRGQKSTFSTIISMNYVDIGNIDQNCRVTFEAENNVDFRLGTGKLRNTDTADTGDLIAITRIGESEYELRIFRQKSSEFKKLIRYAVTYIGHQGKKYGYIDNDEFKKILKI
jgi:hypothetical protein